MSIFLDPLYFNQPYFTSLWFVFVLFIYFIVSWFHSKKKITIIELSLFGLIGILVNALLWQYIPDVVYKMFRYYFYFLLGRFLFTKYSFEIKISKHLIPISFLCIALITVRVYTINLNDIMGVYARAFYVLFERMVFAISGIIVLSVFANLLRNGKYFGRLLVFIGNYSYAIYLLHNPWIIAVLSIALQKVCGYAFINIFVVALFGILIPIVLKKIYLLFSKKIYTYA